MVALIVSTLVSGCAVPTLNPYKLAAIQRESQGLMRAYGDRLEGNLPQSAWPKTIASLKPELVFVNARGVDLLIVPSMDGGFGYHVPRDGLKDQSTAGYWHLGKGVYWFTPH